MLFRSVATISASTKLVIYPLPCHDRLNIMFESPQGCQSQISVTDLLGKVVLSEPAFEASGAIKKTLDMRSLESGMYLLSVRNNGTVTTQKVVKE